MHFTIRIERTIKQSQNSLKTYLAPIPPSNRKTSKNLNPRHPRPHARIRTPAAKTSAHGNSSAKRFSPQHSSGLIGMKVLAWGIVVAERDYAVFFSQHII
jgi:hypothetical protein